MLRIVICIMVLSTHLVAADVDAMIRRTYEVGDYTKPTYDKGAAVGMLTAFLKDNPNLSPAEKCFVWVTIARLHSVHATQATEDTRSARDAFTAAVAVMGSVINEDVVDARICLVHDIPEPERRITAQASLAGWLAYYYFMDDATFQASVVFRQLPDAKGNDPVRRLSILRTRLKQAIKVNADNLMFAIERLPKSQGHLEWVRDGLMPGARAQTRIASVEKSTKEEESADTAAELTAEQKEICVIADRLWRLISLWKASSDEDLVGALDRLDDSRVVPRHVQGARLCDLATILLTEVLDGTHIEGSLLNKQGQARDLAVGDARRRWSAIRTRPLQEIMQDRVEWALQALEAGQATTQASQVLRALLGFDLGYQRRVKLEREDEKVFFSDARKLWQQRRSGPWRRWISVYGTDAQTDRQLIGMKFKDYVVQAEEEQRAKIEMLQARFPEVLRFSEQLWPEWKRTPEGRKAALGWLEKNRLLWSETSACAEFAKLMDSLKAEADGAAGK